MSAVTAITHKQKVSIVDHLVLESERKGVDKAKVFPREIKLVNQLFPRYPDLTFWLGINLGFQLQSLAWFKAEGAVELETKWRYHRLMSLQRPPSIPKPIELDKPAKSREHGAMKHRGGEQGPQLQSNPT